MVGIHHAAFAVLLMVGIAAFSAPTPNFGPSVLAMPLVALSLLSLWRAVGDAAGRVEGLAKLDDGEPYQIFSMNLDGTDLKQLTEGGNDYVYLDGAKYLPSDDEVKKLRPAD